MLGRAGFVPAISGCIIRSWRTGLVPSECARNTRRLISREERRRYRNLYKQHENSSFTRSNLMLRNTLVARAHKQVKCSIRYFVCDYLMCIKVKN
ncbi:hypothetical protein JOB18_039127 [Solea senegalensis]|uniref:Uncharacterized protein n=1 Tax=Solea senegalensis TaxID=28829 RepID=A0AAV6T141_SOLSE|nr:hypothetical protein JOB18_039127 [Solea senegalensis]